MHADRKDSLQSYNYFFLEAMRQQDMGNLTAAFDLLRHARELNPQAPEVYYQLASFYVDMKKDALAREYFEKAASLDPENSAYQEKLGKLYVSQKDYPNAIKAFERLYESNKTRSDVLQILYQLYGSQNEYKMMIKCLERLETLEGTNEQISLSKMQIYEQMGEKRKEYDELKSLVDSHPLDLNYRVMFGNWLLQNGKKKEEDPDNSLAKLSMMDYYNNIGDKATAKTILQELLQSPKTEKETKLELLRQIITSSQKDNNPDSTEVMRQFSVALAVPQEDADIYMLKAAYMTLRKWPKAEINRVYEKAIEVEPDNSRARVALIQNIWETEDYDKVIAICRPAIEYNPDEMAFYYFQGMAQFQKHDSDAALETFRKGVGQIKPDSNPGIVSDFYAIMGDILHEKGRNDEAFQAYDSCLQWKADNVAALNNYAYYLSEENKNLTKAEQMSYKTIKAEPNNSTYLDTYAWILFQQKRYEEAKIYIEQAIRNDSTLSNVVKEHAGDIYAQTGDIEKALADNALYQKNLVSNLTFTLNDGRKDITVPGILRMRKDEVIRLQLLIPILRSEVGRIEFAKDYVLFIDRIHKQYVKASYDEVGFLRDNGVNFYSLQSLFWNQVFIPRQQKVSEADLSQFAVDESKVQTEGSTLISLKDGKMDYQWSVNPKNNQIVLTTVTYNSNAHGASKLSWSYDDFKAFGSKQFPASQVLTINTPKFGQKPAKTLKANFDLEGFSDASDWEVFTTPSDKYTKVSVEDILGKLMNF